MVVLYLRLVSGVMFVMMCEYLFILFFSIIFFGVIRIGLLGIMLM